MQSPLFYQLNDNSLGLLDGHALLITNNSASLRLEQQRAVAGLLDSPCLPVSETDTVDYWRKPLLSV